MKFIQALKGSINILGLCTQIKENIIENAHISHYIIFLKYFLLLNNNSTQPLSFHCTCSILPISCQDLQRSTNSVAWLPNAHLRDLHRPVDKKRLSALFACLHPQCIRLRPTSAYSCRLRLMDNRLSSHQGHVSISGVWISCHSSVITAFVLNDNLTSSCTCSLQALRMYSGLTSEKCAVSQLWARSVFAMVMAHSPVKAYASYFYFFSSIARCS